MANDTSTSAITPDNPLSFQIPMAQSAMPQAESEKETLFVSQEADDMENEELLPFEQRLDPRLFDTNLTSLGTENAVKSEFTGELDESSSTTTSSSSSSTSTSTPSPPSNLPISNIPDTTNTSNIPTDMPLTSRKRGRPGKDTMTKESGKKAKKDEEFNAWAIDWYKEDHAHATVESFRNFGDNIKTYIEKSNSFSGAPPQDLMDLRQQLHQMQFHESITNDILAQSGIFDALQSIWLKLDIFPQDMADFASEMYWKWGNGRQSSNIYEGYLSQITVNKSGRVGRSWKADNDATVRPAIRGEFFGDGHLYNGQWWPKQYLAVRDGAHSSAMAGISGSGDRGAYSIVMSGFKENTEDEDNGDVITYCGQAGKLGGGLPTGTQHLLKAFERGNDIRVLRTAKLPKKNQYRPERGIRYDGLYKIISVEKVATKSQESKKSVTKEVGHRFVLRRNPNQSPICTKDTVGARPTIKEIEAYDEAEKLLEQATEEAKNQVKGGKTTSGSTEAPFTEDDDYSGQSFEDIEDIENPEDTKDIGDTKNIEDTKDIEDSDDAFLGAALLASIAQP